MVEGGRGGRRRSRARGGREDILKLKMGRCLQAQNGKTFLSLKWEDIFKLKMGRHLSSKWKDIFKLNMGRCLQAQKGVGAAHQASQVSVLWLGKGKEEARRGRKGLQEDVFKLKMEREQHTKHLR